MQIARYHSLYPDHKINIPIRRKFAQGSVMTLDRLASGPTVQRQSKSYVCSHFDSGGSKRVPRESRDLIVKSGGEAAHKIVGVC
jgi:hypothetical protein